MTLSLSYQQSLQTLKLGNLKTLYTTNFLIILKNTFNLSYSDLLSSIFNIQAYDALILRNIGSQETTIPTTDVPTIPTTEVIPTTTKEITTTPNASAALPCSVFLVMLLIVFHTLF